MPAGNSRRTPFGLGLPVGRVPDRRAGKQKRKPRPPSQERVTSQIADLFDRENADRRRDFFDRHPDLIPDDPGEAA